MPENTLVIASSISNGAYAALAAAEQDTRGLIDGLALSEPNVSLADVRSTLDTSTLLNVYVPCASLADSNRAAPFDAVPRPLREARCASLAKKGLLRSSTLAQQAAESQRIINEYGILPDANLVLPSHYNLAVMQGIAVSYANSYGRFSVLEPMPGIRSRQRDWKTRSPSPTASRRPPESTWSIICRPQARKKTGYPSRPPLARAT
jgi:hydroxybutyrate-dimer hydrolase